MESGRRGIRETQSRPEKAATTITSITTTTTTTQFTQKEKETTHVENKSSGETAHHLFSRSFVGVVLNAHNDALAEVVPYDNVRIRSNDALPRRTNLQANANANANANAKAKAKTNAPYHQANENRCASQCCRCPRTLSKTKTHDKKRISAECQRTLESIIFLISTHIFDSCGPDVLAVMRFWR